MTFLIYGLILLITQIHPVAAIESEFSAIFEQELANDDDGNGQKFETLFQPEWNIGITDNLDMTFIGRIRYDSLTRLGSDHDRNENYSSINGPLVDGKHGEISIREWYLDTEIAGNFWRIGKQQVVWGQADGLKVLDVINPQSYREFILDDFDDSRIPLWMINIEIPIGDDDSLQLLWIPDLSYNELAETASRYQITSPLFVPDLPPGTRITEQSQSKPSSLLKDSDFGLRYSKFYRGWDLSANYFYRYLDSPVLYQIPNPEGLSLQSTYERSHLIGGTASNAFGNLTLRLEIGYNSDTYHLSDDVAENGIHNSDELASVIGLDWQGLEDTLISLQWFQSHLFDHSSALVRPQDNNIFSLLYKQTFQNETWDLELLSLYGADQKDSSIQAKLSYLMRDNIKVWIGADIFSGNQAGLFGQFNNEDRITIGFEIGL